MPFEAEKQALKAADARLTEHKESCDSCQPARLCATGNRLRIEAAANHNRLRHAIRQQERKMR